MLLTACWTKAEVSASERHKEFYGEQKLWARLRATLVGRDTRSLRHLVPFPLWLSSAREPGTHQRAREQDCGQWADH
jgi:hypothetical protein